MAVTVSQSPSLFACVTCFVAALAGSASGQASINNVVLSGIPPTPVSLGSTDAVSFTCTVNVTCNETCNSDMLNITWMRNSAAIMAGSDGYTLSGTTHNILLNETVQSANFTSTLSVDGAVNTTHVGQYVCKADLPDENMNSMEGTLTVQIPPLTVSLTGGSVTLGSTATLKCIVTLQDYPSYSSIPITVTVDLLNDSMVLMNDSTPTGSSSTRTSVFTISDVSVFTAGQYQCRATVGTSVNNVMNSVTSALSSSNITVQIPPPSATLTSNVVLAGSPATLQCTVMLHSSLTCSGPVMVMVNLVSTNPSNSVIDTETATGSGSTCDAVSLNISSMVGTSGGRYSCHVQLIYTTYNSAYVTPPGQIDSNTATLYVVDSTATATPSTVLDVSPYNNFSLTCSVSVNPSTPIPTITYQWTGDNIAQQNTAITAASATTAGLSSYQCSAMVNVSILNPVVTSDTTTVTVRGPSFPNVPVGVSASPFPSYAVISFTITSVTYTPETYTVRYGILPSYLNMTTNNTATSVVVDSMHSFITTTNQSCSIVLTGLSIDTTYYYQVVATNTIGSSSSTAVFNFTTGEAPPGPPSNLRLVPIDSTSLNFSWEMPSQPNGVVIGYNYSCTQTESAEKVARNTTNSNITSVVLTGLSPFTNYTCSVSASTSPGPGAAATQTGITNMTAPDSPPDNFTITSSSSTMLTLQWQAPVRPNGIITQYRYSCTQVGVRGERGQGTFTGDSLGDHTTTMMTDVTGLTPYTRYNCSVYASTSIGEGPGSSDVGTTGEDVPGCVENFQVMGQSPNTFNILWRSPMVDNGNILAYTITVTDYTNGIVVYSTNQAAVTNDDDESYMYTTPSSEMQIVRYVPYNVSITANTTAGEGPTVTVTNFTQQGTPLPVQNVMATRINNTAIRVSWNPLTLTHARGFLTGYTITLTPISTSRKRQTSGIVTVMAGPTNTSRLVTGLDPTQHYSVTVAGRTSVGGGDDSPAVTPAPPSPQGGFSELIIVPVVTTLTCLGMLVVAILVTLLVMRKCQNKPASKGQNQHYEEPEGTYEMVGTVKTAEPEYEVVDHEQKEVVLEENPAYAVHSHITHEQKEVILEENPAYAVHSHRQ